MGKVLGKIDLMVRVLAVAIVLAFVAPATGEARVHAQTASNLAIFVLFLLNGLRIDRRDILRGLANLRFLVPLMVWIFGGMTLGGWGLSLALAGWVPPLVALGFLYLGTLPSTIQSATSYSMLAGGNAALSVIAAALVNIAGVFITAPLFAAIAGSALVEVGDEVIVRIGMILVLPFLIGQAVQGHFREWTARNRHRVVWVDRFVIALAVYVAFSGAVEQDVWDRISLLAWTVVVAGLVAMLLIGHAAAWMIAGAVGLPRPDRISFMFAGGQKSAAIGIPLGALLFPSHIAGLVLIPILLYHQLQLLVAAPLSSRLARFPD